MIDVQIPHYPFGQQEHASNASTFSGGLCS